MQAPQIRLTLRWLLAVIALVAIALAVSIDRRQRRADLLIYGQIEVLERAAAHERQRQREEVERIARCVALAEDAEREARRWPESSAEHARHSALAAAWSKAASPGSLQTYHGDEANRLEAQARHLTARRAQSWGWPPALDEMAEESRLWFRTTSINATFPPEMKAARMVVYLEREAAATGRTTFPTPFGPRSSAIEATALWLAAEGLRHRGGPSAARGMHANAVRQSEAQPFLWTVTITDPRTGWRKAVRTSFSPSTVTDYLAKNP